MPICQFCNADMDNGHNKGCPIYHEAIRNAALDDAAKELGTCGCAEKDDGLSCWCCETKKRILAMKEDTP